MAAVANRHTPPGLAPTWTGELSSQPLMTLATAVGGGMVAAGVLGAGWPLAAIGVASGAAIATVSKIAVTVDQRGLEIAYGPLGWPRQRVAPQDIAGAEAVEINPWRVGGWGIRLRPHGIAVVVRGGEGGRVSKRNGRQLLVTLPDAAAAAARLNDLRGSATY